MRAVTEAVAGQHTRRAFSLLELVIAMAIVAVVAAYAVPTYVRHTARGHRIAAVTGLYRAAQFLEAHGNRSGRSEGEGLPPGLEQAPSQGLAVYRLRVLPGALENGGYAIEARPANSGPMRDDACGTFVLDATGKRSNRATAASAPLTSDCWSAR
ncbi:MAG: type pilus assembly protein PilE [Paraburkholderia sp.]|nr:type pilus assembly protein PilE [Paraburkholderia sp.]